MTAAGSGAVRRRGRGRGRSRDWNAGLGDLRDPVFAREFLLAGVAEGVSVQVTPGKVILATGIDALVKWMDAYKSAA